MDVVGNETKWISLSLHLAEAGIKAPAIRFPTVPRGNRSRAAFGESRGDAAEVDAKNKTQTSPYYFFFPAAEKNEILNLFGLFSGVNVFVESPWVSFTMILYCVLQKFV